MRQREGLSLAVGVCAMAAHEPSHRFWLVGNNQGKARWGVPFGLCLVLSGGVSGHRLVAMCQREGLPFAVGAMAR